MVQTKASRVVSVVVKLAPSGSTRYLTGTLFRAGDHEKMNRNRTKALGTNWELREVA